MPARATENRLFKVLIINDCQTSQYPVTSKTLPSRTGRSLEVIERWSGVGIRTQLGKLAFESVSRRSLADIRRWRPDDVRTVHQGVRNLLERGALLQEAGSQAFFTPPRLLEHGCGRPLGGPDNGPARALAVPEIVGAVLGSARGSGRASRTSHTGSPVFCVRPRTRQVVLLVPTRRKAWEASQRPKREARCGGTA